MSHDESEEERFGHLLDSLARMAGGDLDHRIAISERHDYVDAVSHAINVLVGELQLMTAGLRRAKEEAEAANLAKTTFLRNVSHEIRTPLTVVLGMSDLIASERVAPERVPELKERIAANGRALVGILDDLLDLAKVEADKLDFDIEPLSVTDALADVVASFEHLAGRKGLELIFDDEDEDEDWQCVADPKRLRQILTNVMGNAVKFTEDGHVQARIGRLDRATVFVDVSDTGIGLTDAQRALLFEPFAQADSSIAGRFGGSGLGLALSKRLAEAMGGSLDVLDSKPGVGTTFRLLLPAAPADADVERPAAPALRSATELAGRRILVADDNDEVRAVTASLLRLVGAEVVEAANGQEALDRYGEARFDAILMDVRMPLVDGLEATRRLRARGAELTIIAMTADALAEQKTACLEAGCSDYLTKPLDFDHLIAVLRGRDG